MLTPKERLLEFAEEKINSFAPAMPKRRRMFRACIFNVSPAKANSENRARALLACRRRFHRNTRRSRSRASVPRGVLCLLSALRFHDLTTQNPFEIWLAIERDSAFRRSKPCRCAFFASRRRFMKRESKLTKSKARK